MDRILARSDILEDNPSEKASDGAAKREESDPGKLVSSGAVAQEHSEICKYYQRINKLHAKVPQNLIVRRCRASH